MSVQPKTYSRNNENKIRSRNKEHSIWKEYDKIRSYLEDSSSFDKPTSVYKINIEKKVMKYKTKANLENNRTISNQSAKRILVSI